MQEALGSLPRLAKKRGRNHSKEAETLTTKPVLRKIHTFLFSPRFSFLSFKHANIPAR
jgi:hypothetical protein